MSSIGYAVEEVILLCKLRIWTVTISSNMERVETREVEARSFLALADTALELCINHIY